MNDDPVLKMKELPIEERPREKLLAKGAQALSNAELQAILLRTGTKKMPVNRLADKLLKEYKLTGLGSLTPEDLKKIRGIGTAKAVTVAAGIELGIRLSTKKTEYRPIIKTAADVAELIMPELRYKRKEYFIALLLSTKNNVIAQQVISEGTLNASIVHPRELFYEAIRHNAAAVIIAHNHPSGDPTPSREDILLTRSLVNAGNILEISILDHIIIGDGKYVSLKEKGII